MKLNKNSFTAYIYKFFYNVETLPTNLCPYFWKLVLSLILVGPYIIAALPLLIYQILAKEDNDFMVNIAKVVLGLLMYCGLFIVFQIIYMNYHLIKACLHCYSYNKDIATVGAILDIMGIVITGAYFLCNNWYNIKSYIFGEKEYIKKEYESNILIEFILAKYKKYCPQIDWK